MISQYIATGSNFARETLLTAIGLVVIAGPFSLLSIQQIHTQAPQAASAPLPSFEVASVKPNPSLTSLVVFRVGDPGRFIATNMTPKVLIEWAYNVNNASMQLRDDQISGGPGWINYQKYDINAKADDSQIEILKKLPPGQRIDQVRLMVQSLLASRFHLKVSHATKELPVYALVVAPGGPKLIKSTSEPNTRIARGQITAVGATISDIAEPLSRTAPTGTAPPELGGRGVIDQTGLTGTYDFVLRFASDSSTSMNSVPDDAAPSESKEPSIFTALEEQLGLRLKSTKSPVDVLVIDYIEEPSEN